VTARTATPCGFACTRCGSTGQPGHGRRCERCTLTDKLVAALDDGTGRVNPALTPLLAALAAMDKPRAGLIWLQNPKVPQLLGDLATGRIPLTHEGLHAAPSWRTAAYLRDLLMTCGVLPTIDKQLVAYEAWLHRRLAELADSPHLRLLRQFAVWQQLPRLRAKAERRPLTLSVRQYASDQFIQAQAFLAWLQARDHTLAEATQADLDAWHATHNGHQRRTLRAFLRWTMATGHLPTLELPRLPITRAAPITQHRRLELLGQVLTDDHRPLRSRVAACLMLLFAQPATRIARLTVDDITRTDDGGVFIRLGQPPTPVPEPFATLLLQATAQRDNLQTATNPRCPLAVPRTPSRPATQRQHPHPARPGSRHPRPGRPDRRAAPTRPAGPSTRRGPGTGLQPRHHNSGRDRGRNALEPLRPRPPQPWSSA
jgi:hypothetical protein